MIRNPRSFVVPETEGPQMSYRPPFSIPVLFTSCLFFTDRVTDDTSFMDTFRLITWDFYGYRIRDLGYLQCNIPFLPKRLY